MRGDRPVAWSWRDAEEGEERESRRRVTVGTSPEEQASKRAPTDDDGVDDGLREQTEAEGGGAFCSGGGGDDASLRKSDIPRSYSYTLSVGFRYGSLDGGGLGDLSSSSSGRSPTNHSSYVAPNYVSLHTYCTFNIWLATRE